MIVVPAKVKKNGRRYKLIKIFKNHVLYEDIETKTKTCFSYFELGLIKDNSHVMKGFKRSPEKVIF